MIKEFFKPTWLRIVLFPILLMLLPALFRVCDATCRWQFEWLAGINLIKSQEIGDLTFLSMLLWFFIAYLLACLIAENYEYFSKFRT